MISRILITGGGGRFLRLYFVLPMLFFSVVAAAEQPPYKGVIDYYNVYVNQFLTLDISGNITLGDLFGEGEWRFWIDATGHILLGYDNDFATTKSLKWYRIEEDGFVESPQRLPVRDGSPVAWAPTPFRVILGELPFRVWQLNPLSLEATIISEFNDPEAFGYFAALVPELNFLYLNVRSEYKLRRVQYNDATGIISGPVTIFPTPRRGNMDMTQTSDGRLIVQLSSSGHVTIFHVEDDGGLTVTQNVDSHSEFDVVNIHRAAISPDDRFLFVIALDGNNVNSFDLSSSGTITAITRLTGFVLAQALALTPDGKLLVVAHHYYGGYPAAILSVFEVGEDGSLTYLSGKDIPLSNTVAELAFFPPPTELSTAAKNWTFYD